MPNLEAFAEKISTIISPGLSAKETAERIIYAALEVEFGRNFTQSPGFAKIVSRLAEVIVTNPELRRQALSLARTYSSKKSDHKKD